MTAEYIAEALGVWAENRASNSVAFAWFVWEGGSLGDAELDRISWNRGAS
jgi:hypothetical protein